MNSAPQLGIVPDQVIVETNTVFFSNAATDADVPANTLTYTLVNPPVGASINASVFKIRLRFDVVKASPAIIAFESENSTVTPLVGPKRATGLG